MFMGCHNWVAEMLLKVRAQGKGQVDIAEMPTLLHPSQPITGGHAAFSEMPSDPRPQLFTWCRARSAEMPTCWRTIGESQRKDTEMSMPVHSPQPITGGHACNAEMPLVLRPHRIWAIFTPQQCQRIHAQITTTRGQSKSAK